VSLSSTLSVGGAEAPSVQVNGWGDFATENATVGSSPQMVVKDQGYHPQKCAYIIQVW